MVEIKYNSIERTEKPQTLTNKNIIFWAEKEGLLIGDMKSKAKKFLENNCIVETDEYYLCLPIEGYNKTIHKISKDMKKCTCQANTKNGIECSHIIAVKLFNFKKDFEKNAKLNKFIK